MKKYEFDLQVRQLKQFNYLINDYTYIVLNISITVKDMHTKYITFLLNQVDWYKMARFETYILKMF
jgi:hypothetical protein